MASEFSLGMMYWLKFEIKIYLGDFLKFLHSSNKIMLPYQLSDLSWLDLKFESVSFCQNRNYMYNNWTCCYLSNHYKGLD